VAAAASAVQDTYDTEVEAQQAAYEAFVEASERRVSEFERAGTMTRSEMDRLRANIDRQISVERERFETAEDAARQTMEAGFETLDERRRAAADRLGLLAGGGGGALVILLGLGVYGLRVRS
jgi:hypothetical protein